jgi:hypothetical protein
MRIDVEEKVVHVLKCELEIVQAKFVRQTRRSIERAFVDLVTDYRLDGVRKNVRCASPERQALTDILSNDIEFFIAEIRLGQSLQDRGKSSGRCE